MVTVTRQRTSYIETEDGQRRQLDNLPEVFEAFIYKLTNKRYALAESRIKDVVTKFSQQLFILIASGMNKPSEPEWVTSQGLVWQKLRDGWLKRKGHSNYWYGLKKTKTGYVHLRDWFKMVKGQENNLLGEPVVKAARNLGARGLQNMTISIKPWPKKFDSSAYEQTKKIYDRNIADEINEEKRPIISPAMQYIIENHIRKNVLKILKEVMTNGK